MKKRNNKRTFHQSIIQLLAATLAVILMLNTAGFAYAKEALIPQISGYPLPLSDDVREDLSKDTTHVTAKGFEIPGDTCLTGLSLKDLDEPAPGKPFDKNATVISKEGTTWVIPVFWIDEEGKTADVPEEGKTYMPLLVFFVPDGFTSDGILTLPSFLSELFLSTGGVLTIVDYEHGITYITGNATELPAFKDDNSAEGFGNEKREHPDDTRAVEDPNQQSDQDDGQPSDKPEKPDDGQQGDTPEDPDKGQPGDKHEDPDKGQPGDKPEDPDDGQPGDKPENPDNGQPGDKPEDPDDEQPGNDPENPDDEQPGDEPEETDPYVAFAEKYRKTGYRNIAWAEELEALGGMENVDFVRLIRECGYNLTTSVPFAAGNAFEDQELNRELSSALRSARETVRKEIIEQADPYLKAHVDETLILKSNPESLLAFVHSLIDNIIPQTILVLRENFPAFAKAPDEAFSKDLGFEILSGADGMGTAYGSYERTNDFQLRMQVYPETFEPGTDEKGAYTFNLSNNTRILDEFKATMLHEMMHIFMYDYNRNGMDDFNRIAKTENNTYPVPGFGELTKDQISDLRQTLQYPNWFVEGIASLSGSFFWSHNYLYSDIIKSADGASLSAAELYTFIQKEDISLDGNDADYDTSIYNDYVFGSLAVLYMGEMYVRKTVGESTVRLDENGKKTIDTMSIRDGISDILERMHNGETMDSIFADISDGRYKDTREFCEKCLQPEGADEDVLIFMADVLNYVKSLNDENGSPVAASILRPFEEDVFDLIDETKSAKTDVYVVSDEMGFAKSTASEEITTQTGGKSDPSHILSNFKEEETSGKTMNSGKNPLSADNAISEVSGQPGADAQTDDIAGQEVSEPECRGNAEELEAENQDAACESGTEQYGEFSGFGAGEAESAPTEQGSEAASAEQESEAA